MLRGMRYRKGSAVICPKCAAPALNLVDRWLIWMFVRQAERYEFATFCKVCRYRIYITRGRDDRLSIYKRPTVGQRRK